jgi:hypothetical protein
VKESPIQKAKARVGVTSWLYMSAEERRVAIEAER